MSIFAVNHLCRELLRDHAFRAAMKADPAKALAAARSHRRGASALLAGDVGALYRMGANAFLMNYLARFEVCGLNTAIYNERMRAVKVDEIGQPVRCHSGAPKRRHARMTRERPSASNSSSCTSRRSRCRSRARPPAAR